MISLDVLKSVDELGKVYRSGNPYPHIVIDNFFNPTILNRINIELDQYNNWSHDGDDYVKDHQIKKYFSPNIFTDKEDYLAKEAPITKETLTYFNSREVTNFLERLTGINELSGDDQFHGGGVHKTMSGGKLSIHVDFNIHTTTKYHRRINLLLYLNKNWKTEWGGDLELWTRDMSRCAVKVAPIFNRAVIFSIGEDTYHGHPHPMMTPKDVSRLSLALYYYTKDRPAEEIKPFHPVLWKEV